MHSLSPRLNSDMLHIGSSTHAVQHPHLLRLVNRSFPVRKILGLGLHRLEGFVIAVNLATVCLDL